MGLVGVAFLLFILGLVFAVNPRLGAEWARWWESMARAGTLVRPPEGLIGSAILFFNLAAISGVVVAALRVLSGKWRVRALGDVMGAIGAFIFAFLLTFYQSRSLTSQQVIAIEAAAMGLLLLIYIVAGIAWGLGRWAPRPEAQRPSVRP